MSLLLTITGTHADGTDAGPILAFTVATEAEVPARIAQARRMGWRGVTVAVMDDVSGATLALYRIRGAATHVHG